MVDINQKDRAVRVKIVYYGPALGGKTTNLQVLHERALWARRGEFVSVNSMQDRTILCDLLPLRSGGFRGFDLKLQILAVPGQRAYEATRRVVLKAADGVVFVANSASDRVPENARSLEEMAANLVAHQIDPNTIPFVFQYNKRDLPQIADFDTLQRLLNARHVPAIQAVATQGTGVLETFSAILCAVVSDLGRRYRTMELPAGQSPESWTRQAVIGMFGREKLEAAGPSHDEIELADGSVRAVEGSVHRRVQVSTPDDARPAAAPGAPGERSPGSPEALAASYAEASAELGFVVSDLREERDAASRRLEEMRQALELASDPASRAGAEEQLLSMVRLLMQAGGASSAVLRVTGGPAIALPSPAADALARTPWGRAHVAALDELTDPLVEEAGESKEMAQALQTGIPSYEAVVVVPLRAHERSRALALLYYELHAVVPSRETLGHLSYLAQQLADALEGAAGREAPPAAPPPAPREDPGASLRLRLLRHASEGAVIALLARLPTSGVKRERVALAELLAPFRIPGIALRLPAESIFAIGDVALLRCAVAALVQICEQDALGRGQAPEVTIQVSLSEGGVWLGVGAEGPPVAGAAGQQNAERCEAEWNVVRAVVAAHQAQLTQAQGAAKGRRLTLRLSAG